jgi:hypothetical protein
MLVRASRRENRKLREVATALVTRVQQGRPDPAQPAAGAYAAVKRIRALGGRRAS